MPPYSIRLIPIFAFLLPLAFGFLQSAPSRNLKTSLCMASSPLKPAAIPLMDSGKALARSGELLVDLTNNLGLFGGALSAAGALIRNSGDCLAQAAASCRFKTAAELVCDELREGATCLTEATDKLNLAIVEAQVDEDIRLAQVLDALVYSVGSAGRNLEEAGAGIMTKQAMQDIGIKLVDCGTDLWNASGLVAEIAPEQSDAQLCSQRMAYAAERMAEAGNELQGAPKPKSKGKGWLKG